ncbi:phytanoyl-CoA dioxygenase family protein [Lentibacter sp. XHP0401]|uniref:phytanoyl-CoA dioxygenase family protein n=1 Tax=Lentibacter sp. XHP0401 TaxID=2984334 RepID=UPI0021E79DA4|nr:phytanoyl-CoA dioxygenase family protein [Lentibacter sp. XHP0401]MCV2893254.1 phytanoyl-CoA dioxygenase family protein [Lentibacter sp. XHP0401]
MVAEQSLSDVFEENGRVWLRKAVSEEDLSLFDTACPVSTKAGHRLDGSKALEAALSENSSLICAVRCLAPKTLPVRVVAFNKSDNANWGVPWHQDRVIAVTEKTDVSGYKNWSHKSGTWHCEPPESVLEEMLFVRVHLDDTDESNGAMEIAVASHAAGVVPSANAEEVAKTYPIEICSARRGDVLIMKMLTLHSSKPATVKAGRRVLRLDFSSSQLPPPLSWHRPSTRT